MELVEGTVNVYRENNIMTFGEVVVIRATIVTDNVILEQVDSF